MNLGQELQTVLVTGGTGFVGGAVAQRLRSESCTVRALVRRNSDTAALSAAGCELRYGDISEATSVQPHRVLLDSRAEFDGRWDPRRCLAVVVGAL